MNRARPSITLTRIAGFNPGYTFEWRVDPAFRVAGTRTYVIEESNDRTGPWTPISPELTLVSVWSEDKRRIINRDEQRYFRVKLMVGTKVEYSPTVGDCNPDDLRRINLITELFRREKLQSQTHTGVPGTVYLRNREGLPCTTCLDPIVGNSILGDDCPVCGGVKLDPPFNGPYPAWLSFTTDKRVTTNNEDGIGKTTAGDYSIRLATPTQVRTGDLIVDTGSGVIYYIDSVDVLAEIQRCPVVQEAKVNVLPTTDNLYNLNMFNV